LIATVKGGIEYVMSQETTSYGFRTKVEKKSECWYFNVANKVK
jgi:hypothetical protein